VRQVILRERNFLLSLRRRDVHSVVMFLLDKYVESRKLRIFLIFLFYDTRDALCPNKLEK